ncbi:MAG: hypothetical protein V4594_04455 [Bacteroidota bacterium]
MKHFFSWLFLALPLFCSAQSNYYKGYVITNAKAKLTGYVDFQGKMVNPTVVHFKKRLDGQAETYDLSDCAGYGINGKASFERYTVNATQAYTRTSRLEVGLDTTTKRYMVFLRVLQKGKKLSLFVYTDEIKTRFYLMGEKDIEPYELLRTQYLKLNDSKIYGDYTYRTQMSDELNKHDNPGKYNLKKLDVLQYEEDDLLKVVSSINGERPPRAETNLGFFVGGGVNNNIATYSGSHALANDNAKSKNSFSPMATAGLFWALDPAEGRLLAKVEFALFTGKSEVTLEGSNSRHTFEQTSFGFLPHLIYNFYNGERLKIYAGLGGGVNYTNYSNNLPVKFYPASNAGETERIEKQDGELEPVNAYIFGRAGIVLRKRFEFSVSYQAPSKITSLGAFNTYMERTTFGVNYLFGGK